MFQHSGHYLWLLDNNLFLTRLKEGEEHFLLKLSYKKDSYSYLVYYRLH